MINTMRIVPFAAVLLLGISAHAEAQNSSASNGDFQVKSLQELDDDNESARWNNLTVDQLEDMDILDANGDEVGEVDEVLGDGKGNIVAVAAEIGGFLGIGEKEVIISMAHFQIQGANLVTSLSKEQMEALPRWDDD